MVAKSIVLLIVLVLMSVIPISVSAQDGTCAEGYTTLENGLATLDAAVVYGVYYELVIAANQSETGLAIRHYVVTQTDETGVDGDLVLTYTTLPLEGDVVELTSGDISVSVKTCGGGLYYSSATTPADLGPYNLVSIQPFKVSVCEKTNRIELTQTTTLLSELHWGTTFELYLSKVPSGLPTAYSLFLQVRLTHPTSEETTPGQPDQLIAAGFQSISTPMYLPIETSDGVVYLVASFCDNSIYYLPPG